MVAAVCEKVVSLMEKYNPLSLVGISRGPREWGNEFVILCRGMLAGKGG